MRIQTLAILAVLSAALFFAGPAAHADTLKFTNGGELDGVIKKVDGGKVFVVIGEEEKVFDILGIESMDFNTPHLEPGMRDVSREAQQLVRNIEEIKKAEEEIRARLIALRTYWSPRQPVTAAEVVQWEIAKEEFHRPLNRYQELLNDLYFYVLAEVDAYNALANEAGKVYVGVKGIRTGSSLVPAEMRALPLKRFVPSNWYNTIFYDGYNVGFSEAQGNKNMTRTHE